MISFFFNLIEANSICLLPLLNFLPHHLNVMKKVHVYISTPRPKMALVPLPVYLFLMLLPMASAQTFQQALTEFIDDTVSIERDINGGPLLKKRGMLAIYAPHKLHPIVNEKKSSRFNFQIVLNLLHKTALKI